MIQATCIQKFKKNNQIYGYRLQDSTGCIKDVYANQLKQAIKGQLVTITNLTLTSDNRLVDTTASKQPKLSIEQETQNLILKAKVAGIPVTELPTHSGYHCTLISKSDKEHVIYIPEYVTELNEIDSAFAEFTDRIHNLQGLIRVIGGQGLTNAFGMFMMCDCSALDLSHFDTHNIRNMAFMFNACRLEFLDLSMFDTSKVTTMNAMFHNTRIKFIDLSSFNTSNVINMRCMFQACKTDMLNLTSFDTRNVTDMNRMFRDCSAQYIDISSFKTTESCEIQEMFMRYCNKIKVADPRILKAYKAFNVYNSANKNISYC